MSTILIGYWYLILVHSVESYEYGYHPSSEEFDNQMREKTWTRDLLWKEKNIKQFSPKFNLQKPKDAPSDTDPEQHLHYVGSSSENKNKFLEYPESDTVVLPSESVAEVNINSFSNESINFHNRSIFPIYFTNPSTGIVYAITEVGIDTSNNNSSRENGSIPIFVSKEQYERDIYLMKKSYESKCIRQGRPQIIKLDGGKFVKKPDPVIVKTKLTVQTNRTRVKGGRKRKNRHRKVKKRKTLSKNEQVQNFQTKEAHPLETMPVLDTQLEKPNKVNLSSVFSSSPMSRPQVNSTFIRVKKMRKPQSTKAVKHKVVRRSLNPERKEANLNVTNSTDVADKPKKILSTQIQVTSEYLEPVLKTRTPKNSIEESTHTVLPQKPPNPPPCKQPIAKDTTGDVDYEDYYGFDGTGYGDDQSDLAYSEDDESDESSEEKDRITSSEENISDYSFPEAVNQETNKYQLKKNTKKRIKRRRPYNDKYDDYDNDYDNESDDGVMGLFRGLLMPVQWVIDSLFDRAALMFNKEPQLENNYNRKPKYPQYTVYNSGANGLEGEENTSGDKGNSFGSWFGSWFGLRKRRGVSTTPTPVEDEPGWLESWFGYDVRTPSPDEEEESDPWFFGWFNSKTRAKRTTTTTTTTPTPILTIAEPLKNPHKWIGLLAQHIVNSTSTLNPIAETTTDNPEIPKKIFYDKYQIWRLRPNDDSQVKVLHEYKRGEEGVRMQWLKGPSLRGLTDVLIPPKLLIDFQGTLSFENIAHEILIFDVGKVISYEETKQGDMIPKKPGAGKAIMSWNRYYDYDSIIKFLELTQLRNPQYVELIHIGRSFEGRPLVIAKLEMKKPKDKFPSKKKMKLSKKFDQGNSVFIEAGIHGREWISTATATWMINELLKTMKNNRTNMETEYIKNTTWYIMPLTNPDSYEYSHQYDRFWKKTRSRHIAKPNGIINSAMTWLKKQKSEKVCFGVDLDCNWHYNWGRKGSSKSPCNEFFSGPTPFSEPETRALSKFLMDNRKQIKLFISLQAYGQIISYPNKMNSSFQAQKLDDLLDVAMVGTDGLRKRGSKSRYKVDSMNDLIENKSGSSDYFATFEVGIPFSYTIHLADNGVHGFLLPGTYIEPTARDTFEIITAMIDYI